jgi:hypothetical protein
MLKWSRKNSRARIATIKEGGVNAIFFDQRVNARRNNHILCVKHNCSWIPTTSIMSWSFQQHFSLVMGGRTRIHLNFKWEVIDLDHLEVLNTEDPFSKDKVHDTIHLMPRHNASGKNGVITLFFKKCWPIIK